MLTLCEAILVAAGANPTPGAMAFAPRGQTFDLPLQVGDGSTATSWLYWHTAFSTSWGDGANGNSLNYHTYQTVKGRWRASKGSAPVNRFTRAFGDNTTEGWHRSMPVGFAVTLTIDVGGNATITVTSGGDVVLEKPIAGSALASLSVSGLIVVDKGVAGSASSAATTTGDVVISTGIFGSATASATTGGAVDVAKAVSGSALVSALTTGDVVSQIFITGSAIASLVGEGTVSQGSLRGDALVPVTVVGAVSGGSGNNNAAPINRGAQ